MMATKATVTTTWKGSGTFADAYRPVFGDDYKGQASWVDAPNSPDRSKAPTATVSIDCTDAVLTQIKADPKYTGKVTDAPK